MPAYPNRFRGEALHDLARSRAARAASRFDTQPEESLDSEFRAPVPLPAGAVPLINSSGDAHPLFTQRSQAPSLRGDANG
jgi:hypothetical protein